MTALIEELPKFLFEYYEHLSELKKSNEFVSISVSHLHTENNWDVRAKALFPTLLRLGTMDKVQCLKRKSLTGERGRVTCIPCRQAVST